MTGHEPPRILICGVAKSGKTTLADSLKITPTLHLDIYLPAPMSDIARLASDHILTDPGPYVIEGVQLVYALRDILRHHGPTPLTGTTIVGLWKPHPQATVTTHHRRQARALRNTWHQIEARLHPYLAEPSDLSRLTPDRTHE